MVHRPIQPFLRSAVPQLRVFCSHQFMIQFHLFSKNSQLEHCSKNSIQTFGVLLSDHEYWQGADQLHATLCIHQPKNSPAIPTFPFHAHTPPIPKDRTLAKHQTSLDDGTSPFLHHSVNQEGAEGLPQVHSQQCTCFHSIPAATLPCLPTFVQRYRGCLKPPWLLCSTSVLKTA